MNIWLRILSVVVIPFGVQSKKLVEKTSCLELAKPSNQQFRLTCSQNLTYHCLLDETVTKEFEVCREWKLIPEGKDICFVFRYCTCFCDEDQLYNKIRICLF